MKISLVISTRDNLKYLKWSYDSIRKNQGEHEVWICYGVDHCTDGTQDWIADIMKVDPFVRSIENTSGKRLGHTIMYDRIVNEIVDTDIAMIFHSDMYLCPGALDAIKYLMFTNTEYRYDRNQYGSGSRCDYDYHGNMIKESATNVGVGRLYSDPIPIPKLIVSLTRIEPPLHPAGPEKVVMDFGTEPENFDEDSLMIALSTPMVSRLDKGPHDYSKYGCVMVEGKTTDGVFAPWAFWVDEFKEIGGHDPLYAPQSKEDSDIFNRFKLNGCEFIQTWTGFVYHLTCRGSRFNPNLTNVGHNSSEWEEQNLRSTRNFIRKWGAMVRHDEYLHPIVPHKYNIGLVVKNCTPHLLSALEIWCDKIVTDLPYELVSEYISLEQPNTLYPLNKRVVKESEVGKVPDILVEIDGHTFRQDDFNAICYLSDILTDSGEPGVMELGNLRLTIGTLKHHENELIKCRRDD